MKKKTRILIALMGLEVGGAETHAVELIKGLAKKDYIIYVVSSGGIYENELMLENIKLIHAPLTSKNPVNMFKSFLKIKSIVKKEKIDLIHAHARIPGFICGFVHRLTKVPFLTTVHGTFSTVFPFKHLTNWGQKSICVSEDIQKYLIENYNIKKENTIVSVNGIDSEKFNKSIDCSDILKEFNIPEDAYKIVYVSRLDEGNCGVGYNLIDIADKLKEKISNLKIIIVGGGTEFDNIKTLANNKNNELSDEVIILTNTRTDVNKFTAMSDCFIGISRAALEALSAENCVILGGDYGYIGVFSEENLQKCIDTNFTCRGYGKLSPDILYNDIIKIYELSDEKRNEFKNFGKYIIARDYSNDKMINDNVYVYDKLLAKHGNGYDFMISGYYGFKNNGDDSLLMAMISNLKSIDNNVKIVVLSKKPDETKRIYNVESISRLNIFKILKYMTKTKVFVNGGGSLIQDVTSSKSLYYYLFILKLAILKKLKIMVYANGIGPVNKKINQKLVKKVVDKADIITLREHGSKDTLSEMNIKNKSVLITADPAFTIQTASDKEVNAILSENNISKDDKFICVSVRRWQKSGDILTYKFSKVFDNIAKKYGLKILFVPMQYPNDYVFSKSVADKMTSDCYILDKSYDADILMGIIAKSELVVAMRLHALIYSACSKTPTIGLIYDPKVKSFLDYANQPYYISVNDVDSYKFYDQFDYCFNNRNEISINLENVVDELKIKAMKNAEIAFDLLNSQEK